MSYKLVYYRAENLTGFESGLMKKNIELDLWHLYEFDIILITGENGTGKSVLTSTLSPLHYPTDKRKAFIKNKREGLLIREYYSKEEHTLIRVKQIYSPNKNKDKGHTCKSYFQVVKNVFSKDDEGIVQEMNPDGNITSYLNLLKVYFGIDKNFLSLSSYNEDVKGMVKMTSSERYDLIRTIIPNTERLMAVYDNLNNKYRDVRAVIRSLSDKISRIRPESTLDAELHRAEKDINRLNRDRDAANSKLSILEGRIKEIQSNVNEDILTQCDNLEKDKYKLEKELNKISESMIKFKKALGGIKSDELQLLEKQYIKKIATSNSKLSIYLKHHEELTEKLYKLETALTEVDATLYSYTNFDIHELKELVNDLYKQLSSLEYTAQKDKFINKDFKEAESFLSLLNTIDSGLSAIDENYSGILRDVFANKTFIKCEDRVSFIYDQNLTKDNITRVQNEILKIDSRIETVNKEIMEISAYQKLEDRLLYRPAECTIDSCAFIKDALKFVELKPTLNILQKELSTLQASKNENLDKLDYLNNLHLALSSYETIRPIIINSAYLFDKYLDSSLSKFFKSYSNSRMFEFIQVAERFIKDQMEILSQKELYIELISETIPKTEKLLQQAQNDANIIKTFETQRNELNSKISKTKSEIKSLEFNIDFENRSIKEASEESNIISEYTTLQESYREMEAELVDINEALGYYSDKASKIVSYIKNIEILKSEIRLIDDEFKPLIVKRDSLKFEQIELLSLKQEKAIIEKDFAVLDILRGFVQPGKKIWKILSQIYMHDVKTMANMLLEQTFDGNLYLNDIDLEDDFVIPYTFNGLSSEDVSFASSSQQTTMSNCLSLAMLSILLNKYGILTLDEIDKDLSHKNKADFIDTITINSKKMGMQQLFIVTHNLEYYRNLENVGFISFPGSTVPKKYDYKTIYI